MKTLLMIGMALFLSVIITCKKKQVTQTFEYCDLHGIVLKYPSDTTTFDSVEISLDCDSKINFKAYADFNNSLGIDPSYSNKVIALLSSVPVSLLFIDGFGCAQTFNRNDEISALITVNSTDKIYWRHLAYLVLDLKNINCRSLNAGELFVPLLKEKDGKTFTGWLRCSVAPDKVIFYDCAFSHQEEMSIKAGQH
jgi:hypothetical protein